MEVIQHLYGPEEIVQILQPVMQTNERRFSLFVASETILSVGKVAIVPLAEQLTG